MTFSALSLLLVLHLGFAQSSHQHLHEDHYVGQQHNPERDMKVLLGDEVSKYNSLLDPLILHSLESSFFVLAGH